MKFQLHDAIVHFLHCCLILSAAVAAAGFSTFTESSVESLRISTAEGSRTFTAQMSLPKSNQRCYSTENLTTLQIFLPEVSPRLPSAIIQVLFSDHRLRQVPSTCWPIIAWIVLSNMLSKCWFKSRHFGLTLTLISTDPI